MSIIELSRRGRLFDLPLSRIEYVIASCLSLPREKIFAFPEFPVDDSIVQNCMRIFARLSYGEPLEYLLEKVSFYGQEFYIDARCFIPRPETEHIVALSCEFLSSDSETFIIDVGTGSGVLAISFALAYRFVNVLGIDIDEHALAVASLNRNRFNCEKRVFFEHGDLLAPYIDNRYNYPSLDIIVANLPYIGIEEFNWVDEGVLRYEPHTALFAGNDGLDAYRRLFLQIKEYSLHPKSILIELGEGQMQRMSEYVLSLFPSADLKRYKDIAGIERVLKVDFIYHHAFHVRQTAKNRE